MFQLRWLSVSLLLLSLQIAPASAQTHALLLFGHGGRMFPLVNLSEVGDDFSSGRAYGGGLGVQLGRKTAIRASVNIAESEYRGTSLDLSDAGFSHMYYGLDLMFGAPSNFGMAPYFFLGGGRLTIDPAESGIESYRKAAGRLGAGVNYVPDNSFFVVFAEGYGWVHEFDLFGFDRLQINAGLVGGVAFAIPF